MNPGWVENALHPLAKRWWAYIFPDLFKTSTLPLTLIKLKTEKNLFEGINNKLISLHSVNLA